MTAYDAFISYSHAKDKPIAEALQAVIQSIGKPWWRRRALRIFRDDSSLAASPQLWPEIQSALDRSRYLLLLASPEAASSVWVGKEIEHWLSSKGSHTLLVALTGGDLQWDNARNDFMRETTPALPPCIVGKFPSEPKWVDLRPYRDGGETASKRNPDFLTRAADLAAAIHGVPKEDLLSDELRQQRRALATAWTAAACLGVLAATAAWQAVVVAQEKQRVELALAKGAKSANALVGDLAERFRGQKGIPQRFIIDVLGEGRTLVNDLAEVGGERADLTELKGKALAELSKTLRAQGDTQNALEDARGAVAAYSALVIRGGDRSAEWRTGLAASYDRMGDALFDLGRHAEAETAYRQSYDLTRELGQAGGPVGEENAAVAGEKIAELLKLRGKASEGLVLIGDGLATRERLAVAQPDSVERKRAINVSLGKLAETLAALGRQNEAVTHQRRRVALAETLADTAPDDQDLQRELAQAYRGLAGALTLTGAEGEARSLLEKDLATITSIAQSDPERSDWQLELVTANDRLGDALLKAGQRDDALTKFGAAVETAETLARGEPTQPLRQHARALAYKKHADALRAAGRSDEALSGYRKSLDIRQQLPAYPMVPGKWAGDIEQNFQFLCDLLVERGEGEAALTVAEDRLRYFEALSPSHPGREDLIAQALGSLSWYALFPGRYDRAVITAQLAATMRPSRYWILLNRAHALMLSGKTDAALKEYVANKGAKVTPALSWPDAVRGDFATLRRAGRTDDFMTVVEGELAR